MKPQLNSVLVRLDRATRFLDRRGLGWVRHAGRRAIGATAARTLAVDVDGAQLLGGVQHRGYFDNLRAGAVEPHTATLLMEAASGGTFVDVGAFLGRYSIPAALQGASVVAIEANPRTRVLLRRNLAHNGVAEKVVLHGCAVSDHTGSASFVTGRGNESASGLAPGGAPQAADHDLVTTVELRRLDDLVEDADTVKIDVEGAEVLVLSGMPRLLASERLHTMVVECNPAGLRAQGSSPADLVARLEAAGFDVRAIDEDQAALVPVTAVEGLDDMDYINLFARR